MAIVKNVWLDADAGHDDAIAILLAVTSPSIHLLGVSSTHGNASADWTASNAARCLYAFGAPSHILVYPGATKPLLRPAKHDPEIHGVDGLGGVEGLPLANDPNVLARLAKDERGQTIRALDGMCKHINSAWKSGKGNKVTIISTGPQTNVALFVSVYPELLGAVEEFIFMGGGVGVGNRSAVAEFNILVDPHATQIVLDVDAKKTMVPLNATHTALVTDAVHHRLLDPTSSSNGDQLPQAFTPLRHTLSTLVQFFAGSYRSTFGFMTGPPLHDALTVVYVTHPEFFACQRHRVDVELEGHHTIGETVVDIWGYRECDDTWGTNGKNCQIVMSLQVDKFFEVLLECIAKCDKISPLNK